MARKGLLKTGQPRNPEVSALQASVKDAVEVLAKDHDVISSSVTALVASGAIPPGVSLVVYAGGPTQTLTLPPANALGTNTGASIIVLNTATVAVTVVPSRGDTLNGLLTLSIAAGGVQLISSDGISKWLTSVSSGGGVTDGDKGDITVSGGGTVWTIDTSAITYATITGITYGVQNATATVTDAAIAATSKVLIEWGAVTDTDENTPDMDDVTFTAIPAAGSMTVRLSTDGLLGGAYKIQYMVAA